MTLSRNDLGWSEYFEAQLDELDDALIPARIIGQHRREWDLGGLDGVERAVLAGRRWDPEKEAAPDEAQPTVGDWVAVRLPQDHGTRSPTAAPLQHAQAKPTGPPVIEHVFRRRTFLQRSSMARRGQRQTIVANVDTVFIVAAFAREDSHESVAKRSIHPRRLERYVTAVRNGGAQPVIVLNKSDLAPDCEKTAAALRERLKNIKVLTVSATSHHAMDELVATVRPQSTIGLVGLSGVGKSTIVNALLGSDVQKTSATRESDARGRHTTTHRELFSTPSGLLLIDTPGMREFALADVTPEDLLAFEDIAEQAQHCKFRNCRHQNEPGCAVQAAVLQGLFSEDRVENYRHLLDELEKKAKAEPRKRTQGAAKKSWNRKNRSARAHQRGGGDEEDW
ncbi:MAG: ribosome small subunit-dependent GTPase A [Polyangiaceae bacterium]|nr:ribosome small subunit-dependent GTPase A [Polyangiaceae bacterium]